MIDNSCRTAMCAGRLIWLPCLGRTKGKKYARNSLTKLSTVYICSVQFQPCQQDAGHTQP